MIHSPKNPIISHKIQPTPCLQRLKRSTVPADNSLMGQVVKLPNCREISPEVFRLIARRTKNASHWVRYWSAYWSTANELIGEIDPDEVDEEILDDVRLYLASCLHDRNRAALKARGF